MPLLRPQPVQTPKPYTDAEILKAIEIFSDESYGAMRFMNALSGDISPEWEILHSNKWTEIIAEAKERQLDIEGLKCAVSKTPVIHSATFQFACGKITDLERHRRFQVEVKKSGEWTVPA